MEIGCCSIEGGFTLLHILASQFERVGFLIAMLFLLSRQQKLRQFMRFQGERRNLWIFILLFSFFAVLGTYSGVHVTGNGYSPEPWTTHISGYDAISTNRTIGVVIAGLFGGVRAGFIVGVIAGIHRYSLGGFVAVACMVAPILEGIFAGLMKSSLKKRFRHISSVQFSFLVGFIAESAQMILILLIIGTIKEQFGALVVNLLQLFLKTVSTLITQQCYQTHSKS